MFGLSQVYLVTALALATLGLYCIASKRNIVKAVIGLELVTVAVNLSIIALNSANGEPGPLAQSMAILSMCVGASIAAIALALVVNAVKHYGSVDLKEMRRLRW